MNLNERQLKITGSVNFIEEIDTEKEVKIIGELEIYEVAKRNNQDGTFNLVYKAKFPRGVEIETTDKKIQTKDKTKASVLLRRKISQKNDSEEYYQKRMKQITAHYEEIEQFLDDNFY